MSRAVWLLVLVLLGAGAAPAAAGAHEPPPGGLRTVRVSPGVTLLTHGADPRPAAAVATAASVAAAAQRPPTCATADAQRVLYGRPAWAPDRSARMRGTIERLLRQADAELDRAGMASGGRHADYRVVCDASGAPDVGTFTSTGDGGFAAIVAGARAAGADDPRLDYTIFYDDPAATACGIGSYAPDGRAVADNVNNAGGGYAVVYPPCWDTTTLMHEIGHTQGAVPPDAPHGTGRLGHCSDEQDVMCYADGGEHDTGTFLRCPGPDRFDCGYDDYFDTAPEPGEYLAGHWNLGSPLNRFLRFSDPLPGAAAGTSGVSVAAAAPSPGSRRVALRIAGHASRPVRGRLRVALTCADRAARCAGTLLVRDAAGRPLARRSVVLRPGTRRTVHVRMRSSHGAVGLRVVMARP